MWWCSPCPTNHWTNQTISKSLQPIHLLAMQLTYTSVSAGMDKFKIIEKAEDQSLANLRLLENLRFTLPEDIHTIQKIAALYLY
jgi:hypothetical protein